MDDTITTITITETSKATGRTSRWESGGPESDGLTPAHYIAQVLDAYSLGSDESFDVLILRIIKNSNSPEIRNPLPGLVYADQMWWLGNGDDFDKCVTVTVDAAKMLGDCEITDKHHSLVHLMRMCGIEVINMPGDHADIPTDIHA